MLTRSLLYISAIALLLAIVSVPAQVYLGDCPSKCRNANVAKQARHMMKIVESDFMTGRSEIQVIGVDEVKRKLSFTSDYVASWHIFKME